MHVTEKKMQSNTHDLHVVTEADILQHSKNLCFLIFVSLISVICGYYLFENK